MQSTSARFGFPFAVLCSVPFVMVLSNSLLIPVLPAMQSAMKISLLQVSFVLTAFSIPAGLVIPFGGLGSDHWGRKRILIPALFLFGLGGLIAGVAPLLFAEPFPWILGGRIVQGIGGGGTYQVALALAGDLYRDQQRTQAMGILEASNGLGKVASPILGALLALWVWYAPFYLYPLLAWSSALGVWLAVKEPGHERQGRRFAEYWRDLKAIFKQKGAALAAVFLLGAIALFLLFGVLSWFSDVLEKPHGIDGLVKGFVIAIPVLVMAITAWLAGTVLRVRLQAWLKPAVMLGMTCIMIALAVLPWIKQPVPLTALISLLGFGTGLVLPLLNTLITSAAASEERGLITALYGTVRFFGTALGPPAFGMMLEVSTQALLYAAAGLAAGGLVVGWRLLQHRRLMNQPQP